MIEDIKRPVREHPVDRVIDSGNKIKKRALNNKVIVRALVILIITVVGFIIYASVGSKNASPFAEIQKKNVPFAIYYPTLPPGYLVEDGSVAYQNQIVFFTILNNDMKISVSEQSLPSVAPNLDKLKASYTDFQDINTLAGKGIVGVVNDVPVGILITNTTLISLNASKNVPKDALVRITQSMSSLSL